MIKKLKIGLIAVAMTVAITSLIGIVSQPDAQAQGLGNPAQVVSTNIATGAITTNNLVIGTAKAANVAVQLVLNGLGAGATNSCSVLLQQSVDNVNWLDYATLDLTGTGATTTSCISNLTVNARNIRLRTITSTANGTGTNLSVEVWARTKDGI